MFEGTRKMSGSWGEVRRFFSSFVRRFVAESLISGDESVSVDVMFLNGADTGSY